MQAKKMKTASCNKIPKPSVGQNVIVLNHLQHQELISSPSLWPDEEFNFIEILNFDCDPYQLEKHFKQWFKDYNTDVEHLHLNIYRSDSDILKIKCDSQECLINPDVLGNNSCRLATDIGINQFVSNQNKNSDGKIPIYQLQVIAIVNSSGICESLLYGQPLILIPTQCWKLDWEELENNQQIFITICQLLKQINSVLVAKKDNHFCQGMSEFKTADYFLLFPSENNSLLIRSACSREMLLPNTSLEHSITSDDTTALVQGYLDVLQKLEEYNPIYYHSGLYNLLSQSNKSKSIKRSHNHKTNISSDFCKVSRLLAEEFPTKL
ncbi:meiosis 1 arrest protein-like [Centruroides sculpturatus]|uniref:meiosis 1 arrest protein-like n=1 Tax=Centruroides sculpturatus TaxID=218467 RepID=UPI000C6E9E5F|nr:meiosis 1 arrest protein-like [Centruroides sculpturatus]